MTGNPISIFDVALRHTRTVEVCIHRLQQLGANHELKLLSGRLQRLAIEATPGGDHEWRRWCACGGEDRESGRILLTARRTVRCQRRPSPSR
jgi:hypothetical protein